MKTPQDIDASLQATARPWYKEGWMWLVVGIPLTSVCLGMLMIYLAVTNPHSMVSDNYYKEGLAINRDLGFDRKARELDLKGSLHINGQHISLKLDKPMVLFHPPLEVSLVHPTLSMHDQKTVLVSNDQQLFKGLLTLPLEPVRYAVHIVSKKHEWRIKGVINMQGETASNKVDAKHNPF